MLNLGFVALEENSFISTSGLFPDVTAEIKPGRVPAGARGKEGLTQKQLAYKHGIAQGYISEMEKGPRPIGITTAKILGTALDIGYKVFL